MAIETVRMSSKGQIVIPQDIRDILNAGEGSVFAVVASSDAVILKKIETPSKDELIKDLKKIANEGSKRAEKLNIKESDVQNIIHKIRKSKK